MGLFIGIRRSARWGGARHVTCGHRSGPIGILSDILWGSRRQSPCKLSDSEQNFGINHEIWGLFSQNSAKYWGGAKPYSRPSLNIGGAAPPLTPWIRTSLSGLHFNIFIARAFERGFCCRHCTAYLVSNLPQQLLHQQYTTYIC